MENKYHLVVKFLTETKNEEELSKAYYEIEPFYTTFENYLFYYLFDSENIPQACYESLSDEAKYYK